MGLLSYFWACVIVEVYVVGKELSSIRNRFSPKIVNGLLDLYEMGETRQGFTLEDHSVAGFAI